MVSPIDMWNINHTCSLIPVAPQSLICAQGPVSLVSIASQHCINLQPAERIAELKLELSAQSPEVVLIYQAA